MVRRLPALTATVAPAAEPRSRKTKLAERELLDLR